ncbi:40S small subunit processome assembly factor 1 isoform X2 [Phyllobates terribilis]|uniref:40S small subunit processome assembly factor 1 isoform X2 n=1 Tax=Phyllobates terribilis TaxID=111132 RepID=UPI003CCAFDB3
MSEGRHPSEVQDQLESVLSNLYDFGEDFVTHEDNLPKYGQIDDLSDKNETEKVNGHVENQQPVTCPKSGKKNISMFFDSIKEELWVQAKNPTVSSSSAAKPSTVQVVTFVSRKDKKQCNEENIQHINSGTSIKETEEENSLQFNFEKARLEVHKFGIGGYEKAKQRKCEQERAIMLGAKPPKREYVNYKLYQEKIKEKELAQKEKSLMDGDGPEISEKSLLLLHHHNLHYHQPAVPIILTGHITSYVIHCQSCATFNHFMDFTTVVE